MHPISFWSGFIIDTPGIRGFGLFEMTKDERSHYFREMLPLLDNCKFKPALTLMSLVVLSKRLLKMENFRREILFVDAVVGFGNLFPGLQDSQVSIVFFLGDDALRKGI